MNDKLLKVVGGIACWVVAVPLLILGVVAIQTTWHEGGTLAVAKFYLVTGAMLGIMGFALIGVAMGKIKP